MTFISLACLPPWQLHWLRFSLPAFSLYQPVLLSLFYLALAFLLTMRVTHIYSVQSLFYTHNAQIFIHTTHNCLWLITFVDDFSCRNEVSWIQKVYLPVCSFFWLFQSDVKFSLNFVNHFRKCNLMLENLFLVTFEIVLLIFLFVTRFNCLEVLCAEIFIYYLFIY